MRTFVLIALGICAPAFGIIFRAPNLDILEEHIKNLDDAALVIFDVDCTLLVPNDQLLSPSGEYHYLKFIQKIQALQEEGEIFGSRILQSAEISLVDPKVLNLLHELKLKKIKTIALTAMDAGRFGIITNMENWRKEQLESFGIDFSWAFPKVDSIVIEGFQGKRSVPVFKSGILVSSKYSKGQVLLAFLKKVQCTPSQIVFIDDQLKEIDSMKETLEQENMDYRLFHYTAATDRRVPLDQSLADFQLNYLFQFGKWLGDKEAQSKMGL